MRYMRSHRILKDGAEFITIGENLLTVLGSFVGLELVGWCFY